MSTKLRAIPQIPAGLDPQLARLIAALKENIEVLSGQRGDGNPVIDLLGYTPAEMSISPWPAFHVTASPYPTYDQALTVDRIIGYTTNNNTVRLNSGGHFNAANGRFTIPVDGIYRFDATHSRSGGNASVVISKNGSGISAESLSYGTDWQTATTHVVQEFMAGDYVQGAAIVRNSTTIAMYSASFSGHLIAKT